MKINLSQSKVYWITSLAILVAAFVFRFLDLPSRVIFTEDHALFNIFAYKNIIYHERLQIGPSIGGVWATFPPTFYYLTTFLLKITNFNYYILHIMTAVANLIALILILVFFPKLFGKLATLVILFVYGLSFFVVSQAIVGTNPGIIPPLTIGLVLCCIWLFYEKKHWAMPLLALDISLMSQLHVTPFFLIPGIILLTLMFYREFNPKSLFFVAISGLIIIYAGIRPHYLQNKAFGNQNLIRVVNSITQGVGKHDVTKPQSMQNLLSGIIDFNADVFFPNTQGFQENSPTNSFFSIIGKLISLALIVIPVVLWRKERRSTPSTIVFVLFITYLFFQALIPTYPTYEKPVRWLDAVYLPLYVTLVGVVSNYIYKKISKKQRKISLMMVFLIVTFIFFNSIKWVTDAKAEGRLKLKTIIKKTQVVSVKATKEKNINLIHIGSVNLNPTWPFAFALWKETGDQKYLRTLLWNIDPKRNEPFYIFSDGKDSSLENSEKLAKSFQDNPLSLVMDIESGFLVEKIFNDSSATPASELTPGK